MEGEHWTGGGTSAWRGALDWKRSIQHPVPRENILRWGRLRSSKEEAFGMDGIPEKGGMEGRCCSRSRVC